MPGRFVMIFVADVALELFYFTREELDRTATTGADHVVMAAPIVLVLITRDAIVKCHLAGQPALGQQFQRPINGGIADPGVFLFDQAMKFFGGKVLAGLQEGSQNGIALGSLLETNALQMLVENTLRFTHHFARNGGLVIDTFLQHEAVWRAPPGGDSGRAETEYHPQS